jgi:hypothetical protein
LSSLILAFWVGVHFLAKICIQFVFWWWFFCFSLWFLELGIFCDFWVLNFTRVQFCSYFKKLVLSLVFWVKKYATFLCRFLFSESFHTIEPRYSAIEGAEKIRKKLRFALYRGQFWRFSCWRDQKFFALNQGSHYIEVRL